MPAPDGGGWSLLGLGMSVLDVVQVVGAFPVDSGVTRVIRSTTMGGGPVATALCAAGRLGASTAMIDRIGNDWQGDRIEEDFRKFGVSTDLVQRETNRRSASGTVLVREVDGERHLLYEESDATPITVAELPAEALASCRLLHLNGRHWPSCIDAARIVRESGGLVSFDGGANRFEARFLELLPLVDVLVVARDFAHQLAESDDLGTQLSSLRGFGAKIVGLTDGERGSWFESAEGGRFHQPAFAVSKLVDTTGCGDVFHGAFLFARLRGDEWRQCARFASAAAAINAMALGGRGHLPTIQEVEEFIAGASELNRVG